MVKVRKLLLQGVNPIGVALGWQGEEGALGGTQSPGGTERNRAFSAGKSVIQEARNEGLDGVAVVAKGNLVSGPELSVLITVKEGAGWGAEESRTVGGVVGEVGKRGR